MIKYDHILIDARNALYRAIYAGLADEQFMKSGYDPVVIFFRFVSLYLNKFRPNNVHFFWDAPKATLWRKGLWKDYKEGRDISHGGKYSKEDVDKLLMRNSNICMDLAEAINSRSYFREKQEADDLIFAFCRHYSSDRIVIVSSDGDFKQIPFLMRRVDLYNPMGKSGTLVDIPQEDPVDVKALTGERGDNIIGYPRIGPKTALKLLAEPLRRKKLYEDYGKRTYLLNRALIDLTVNPYLLRNISYIIKVMLEDTEYNDAQIRIIIQKYRVKGLAGEISRILLPFKFIGKQKTVS